MILIAGRGGGAGDAGSGSISKVSPRFFDRTMCRAFPSPAESCPIPSAVACSCAFIRKNELSGGSASDVFSGSEANAQIWARERNGRSEKTNAKRELISDIWGKRCATYGEKHLVEHILQVALVHLVGREPGGQEGEIRTRRSFFFNSPAHPLFPICRTPFPPYVRNECCSFCAFCLTSRRASTPDRARRSIPSPENTRIKGEIWEKVGCDIWEKWVSGWRKKQD